MNQSEFYHRLTLRYRNCGQPPVAKFVSDALSGGRNQARKSKQKSKLEREQAREKRLMEQGLCVRCGKRKPDGVRSQARCNVCLDRCKVSQAKYNARMEAESNGR